LLDEALVSFSTALSENTSLLDPLAGEAIVRSDSEENAGAVDAAGRLLSADDQYVFSHDPTVSAADIRMIKAKSHCALGEFASALQEVQMIDPTFYVDVSTTEGRRALLEKIEELIDQV
jgi:hypothetical protein